MSLYAVIDTNVLVSALITRNNDAATVQVLRAVFDGRITPLYHADILAEYREVLSRPKFHLSPMDIMSVLSAFVRFGVEVFPQPTGEILVDMDDLVFYEVAMEKHDDNARLVTGNLKHYPVRDFIVTPADMLEILKDSENSKQ